jgi:lipoyl(octanoyl) transferase
MIVPCGITDKGVTSLQKELGREIDLEKVKAKVLLHMQELFNFSIQTPANNTLPWIENDSIKSA